MRDTIRLGDARVKMVAHRGVSGLERENTAAAFVAAGNRTYFGVETDIHRTADGKIIVIHDDDTRRVAGCDYVVEETDFDTLRAIRLTDLAGNLRGDLLFPTLEEYVNICKYYNKVCVLELKNHFEPEDIETIISIIRACDYLDQVIFISFDLPNMVCIREKLPEQKAQYLTDRFGDDLLDTLMRYRLDLDIHYRGISKAQIEACHASGIEVNVWTVDSIEDARRLADWGVDYITSNIIE